MATALAPDQLDEYYRTLPAGHLAPLWTVLRGLVTPEPRPRAVPAHWRYGDVRERLMEAGRLITAEEAERRVLILENPAAPGEARITSTLYAGLQLILPGEVAPSHRHTQSALRFVLEGSGAHTAVTGERAAMERFDLVLTPNWDWHDHGNDTDEPMVWLDGLDIPMVTHFAASFAEHGGGAHPATRPAGDTRARWGAGLKPADAPPEHRSPLFHYPYQQWREALGRVAAAGGPDPHQGWRMEFANPLDGGPAMATMSAFCQFLPSAMETAPLRSTDGTVYAVVEGEGRAMVGGDAFDLAVGDVFVVPSWTERRIAADADLVLFSYSDRAAQAKLGLWRENRG